MGENYEEPNIEGLETLPRHVRDLFYADPHAQDELGNTVLHKHVTRDKYYPIMTPRLIARATDLEIKNNNGFTAFLLALIRCDPLMIEAFIEKGTNVHTKNNLKQNALHYLLHPGIPLLSYTLPFLESLLERGVDVNLRNYQGVTPLMWASAGGHLKIVKLLLKFGANVHLTNRVSQSCLHFASTPREWNKEVWNEPNADTITELIRNGACVNCFDYNGRTSLGCILGSAHQNKDYFARKFLTSACLVHWKIRNDFYLLRNRILGGLRGDRSFIQHVDACYKEIGRMRTFKLSEKMNLCQFALRGVSDAEESIASEIRDAALDILVRETFPIYHDFIFCSFQLDYLRRKLMELDIFTYLRGRKISLVPDVNNHIASFLDIKELFNALRAFSLETTL